MWDAAIFINPLTPVSEPRTVSKQHPPERAPTMVKSCHVSPFSGVLSEVEKT